MFTLICRHCCRYVFCFLSAIPSILLSASAKPRYNTVSTTPLLSFLGTHPLSTLLEHLLFLVLPLVLLLTPFNGLAFYSCFVLSCCSFFVFYDCLTFCPCLFVFYYYRHLEVITLSNHSSFISIFIRVDRLFTRFALRRVSLVA